MEAIRSPKRRLTFQRTAWRCIPEDITSENSSFVVMTWSDDVGMRIRGSSQTLPNGTEVMCQEGAWSLPRPLPISYVQIHAT
jgi:hypothetical protein